MTVDDHHPRTDPNPGAAAVIAGLVLVMISAALQRTDVMLASGVLFVGAIAYRRSTATERAPGSERRHLAISTRGTIALLGGTFAVFVIAALLATR